MNLCVSLKIFIVTVQPTPATEKFLANTFYILLCSFTIPHTFSFYVILSFKTCDHRVFVFMTCSNIWNERFLYSHKNQVTKYILFLRSSRHLLTKVFCKIIFPVENTNKLSNVFHFWSRKKTYLHLFYQHTILFTFSTFFLFPSYVHIYSTHIYILLYPQYSFKKFLTILKKLIQLCILFTNLN